MYAELERKICAVCKTSKPINLFYKDKRRSLGVARECKQCKEAETKKRRLLKPHLFKQKRKKAMLKEKFNMTVDQWDKLYENQAGKCDICGTHQSELRRALAVDHDHVTNKVRGLLCDSCNNGLGRFKDSSDICLKASEYLNKFKN